MPCEENPAGENDDKDGSLGPSPHTGSGDQVSGGAHFQQLGYRATSPIEFWSVDEDAGSKMCFVGTHDTAKGVFYAKPAGGAGSEGEGVEEGAAAERSMKGAITTLFDVAEACNAKKITLGLSAEYAGCAEFLCSLLYLGFQVVPSRKSPLTDCALLLDLDIGWPSNGHAGPSSSDFTRTSDCSTSAEDTATDAKTTYGAQLSAPDSDSDQ